MCRTAHCRAVRATTPRERASPTAPERESQPDRYGTAKPNIPATSRNIPIFMASESDKTPQSILVIKAILTGITDCVFPHQKALP
jgi:hypothetical protein